MAVLKFPKVAANDCCNHRRKKVKTKIINNHERSEYILASLTIEVRVDTLLRNVARTTTAIYCFNYIFLK